MASTVTTGKMWNTAAESDASELSPKREAFRRLFERESAKYLGLLLTSSVLCGGYAVCRFVRQRRIQAELDTNARRAIQTIGQLTAILENHEHAVLLREAAVQMALVVSLCIMWFQTFSTAALAGSHYDEFKEDIRWRWPAKWLVPTIRKIPEDRAKILFGLVSCVPALFFVVGMYNAYQPAVFVMALAAIFVAAEHYAGLREVHESHAVQIARLESLVQSTLARVESVATNIDLQIKKAEIYKLYMRAQNRIDAIVKHWDIDEIWWTRPLASAWGQYFADEAETLFNVLSGDVGGTPRVQFVTDLPMPETEAWKAQKESGNLFRQLMGMTWQLVVLHHVYVTRLQRLRRNTWEVPHVRVRVAKIGEWQKEWQHVIDDVVLLSFEATSSPWNPTTKQENPGQAPEVRKRIEAYASRGGSAEEYILSALRYVGFNLTPREKQSVHINDLMNELGMREWMQSELRERECGSVKDDDVVSLCAQTFMKFIELRLSGDALALSAVTVKKERVELQDLALEGL